ncbi:MAG: hypothetical protein U9Q16_02970 [Patescibacteria group bacterium]|nr:hypothetical protein [Patescibacteria group bacterium]
MLEIFAVIILFASLTGMGLIIIRKIPILTELSPQEIELNPIKRFRNRIKGKKTSKFFSKDIILQKTLSKIRILTLKTDNKTDSLLMKLRQKTRKDRNDFSDGYWNKVNSVKEEFPETPKDSIKSKNSNKTKKRKYIKKIKD